MPAIDRSLSAGPGIIPARSLWLRLSERWSVFVYRNQDSSLEKQDVSRVAPGNQDVSPEGERFLP